MPAYRDRGTQWRYRVTITLPDGSKRRIAGTPTVNTKIAAERAEREYVQLALATVAPEGRQPIENPRERTVAVRVTEAEAAAWRGAARACGMTLSDWLRACVEGTRSTGGV
jgi:hypothetical protein